jgi:hypothetical protein
MWCEVERKACASSHSSVDALKAAVNREWANVDANTLMSVCNRFRSRLERCIAAEGGVFVKK